MKEWVANDVDDLDDIAKELLELIGSSRVLYFYGDLGAGKTTFIKRILKQLGLESDASSPSYSLVNVYALKNGSEVFHIDLYRLKESEEAIDIGIENYLYPDFLTLIEWPQIIEEFTPETAYTIQIKAQLDGSRSIKLDTFYE